MNTDADVSLDSDRLEELLESPVPAPPVVVVQERRRGVPTWLSLPLLFVVPICAVLVYHRLVVEPERRRNDEDRRALDNWMDQKLAAAAAAAPRAGVPGDNASAPSAPVSGAKDQSRSPGDPPPGGSVPPALAVGDPATPPGPQSDPAVKKSPASPAADATASDKGTSSGKTATVAAAAVSQLDAAKMSGPPMPASPAADVAPNSPKPTRPALNTGFDDDRDFRLDAPAGLGGFKEPAAPGSVPGGVNPEGPLRDRPAAEQPLPSREQNEREIEEEAKRKDEERRARIEHREGELRAKSSEDRVRFRDEIRDALERLGNRAGSEIDKITRRYSSECEPSLFAKARDLWTTPRPRAANKVKQIRALGVPESVILDFMSADLHTSIGTRNGPRDKDEVRVRAALRLLQYKLPEEGTPAQPQGGNAAGGR
jgi:hypothetical protein